MLADEMAKFEADHLELERVPHAVLDAFAARAWRQGVAGHEAVLVRREQGGGKWTTSCVCCLDMDLAGTPAEEPAEKPTCRCRQIDVHGQEGGDVVEYDDVAPRFLLKKRFVIPARDIQAGGQDGKMLRCVRACIEVADASECRECKADTMPTATGVPQA